MGMRNRRYVQRRGPMLVLPDAKGVRAFRNIFGLDIANVSALNLLALAPGGHLGRFCIWTKSDVTRITRSDEVRRALKPKKLTPKKASRKIQPSNGMKNRRLRLRLNPFEKKRSIASKALRKPEGVRARRQARADRLRKAKKGVAKSVQAKKGGKK